MKRNHTIENISDNELRWLEVAAGVLLASMLSSPKEPYDGWKADVKTIRRAYDKLRVARGMKPLVHDARVNQEEDEIAFLAGKVDGQA